MGSRKEEERNEKIIRGLMKLPPNRRCINCNSLGPQYVCTNFWTFVCTACSGIHREFTHRVKSVSMSKFTAQEVDALQKGGNQRAREIFLKDWDPQRQRLPDSSNVDRVREFIKNVYVDRRYAGGKNSERPPRDMQGLKNQEDETRRASSYHSYSQSPPYDYQYENQRYGKPAAAAAVLTRKPGSDRGHYEGKMSSFIMCSPGHLHDDRFANDSVSSAGNIHSPNSLKDFGSSSSPLSLSRESSVGDVQRQSIITFSERDSNRRTSSSGSFGSFDGNATSFTSVNSGSLMDVLSEPEKSTMTTENKSAFPSLPQPSVTGSLDLFKTASLPQSNSSVTSVPPADLFQLPAVDLFQQSLFSQPPQTCTPPSLDFFAEQSEIEAPAPKNEGWATFDIPPHQMASAYVDGSTSMQWPTSQSFGAHGPSSLISSPWHDGSSQEINLTMSWNAFEDTTARLPFERTQQSSEPQVPSHHPSSNAGHYLGVGVSQNTSKDPMLSSSGIEATVPVVTSHVDPPDMLPGIMSHSTDHKSVNPFDLPYDSGLDLDNVLLDMSSLQATLPNGQLPPPFLGGGVTEPWFPQNPVMSFGPATPQSGLAFMAGQPPTSKLPNITSQGPVASIGGNPFA